MAKKAPTKPTRLTRAQKAEAERAAKKAAFIAAFAARGIVTTAAIVAGIDRSMAYDWYADDEAFSAAWDDAKEQATDLMEEEAFRRSVDGIDRALTCSKGLIYDADGAIMYERQYSDTLLAKMLAANRPHKYGNKLALTDPDGGALTLVALVSEVAEGK